MAEDLGNDQNEGFIDQAEVEEFMNKLTRAEFGPLSDEPEYEAVRLLPAAPRQKPLQLSYRGTRPPLGRIWIANSVFLYTLMGQIVAFGFIWPILSFGACICLGYKLAMRKERVYDDFAPVFLLATAMTYALWWLWVGIMRPFFV